ncbi:MAG TPA: glycosyltransferase family 4 protein [Candidatus Pacearchaeota archaeon]|nr:GDP-mannose-dependent alpha-(1-2)-phosphatidylinositol mannosyltransferase [archaeon BMS3Abin17]HDK42627.1 glycosyltransferase family 4 protein [Candidatus Pacearchaeota archaeon]HDZ60507.1 glycosyltransferase family 4 protein [Candidatus Pacearchaeota archaeon]
MKILQIAPIYIPITLDMGYGGIERVVLSLARIFDEKGHDVITAAPADSRPCGKLLPTLRQSEWAKPKMEADPNAYEEHVSKIIDYVTDNDLDVIHDHTGNFVLSNTFNKRSRESIKLKKIPIIVTPHELKRFKKSPLPKQENIFFTALSNYQSSVFSDFVDVKRVINNGIFVGEYPFTNKKKGYLFSLGSIERDKGQDLAVRVALETGLPLKIGGNIAEQDFYDLEIKDHSGQIEYVGELNDDEKKEFYKNAEAFIVPIRIGDCFSLTRIESLACGTPVITLDTGSAREAVKHGETGYLVKYNPSDDGKMVKRMAQYVRNLNAIDPNECRSDVDKRFNMNMISDKYIKLYKDIISGKLS